MDNTEIDYRDLFNPLARRVAKAATVSGMRCRADQREDFIKAAKLIDKQAEQIRELKKQLAARPAPLSSCDTCGSTVACPHT
jgi:hypothetical protein